MHNREIQRLYYQKKLVDIVQDSDLGYFRQVRFELGIQYIEYNWDVQGSILKNGSSLTEKQKELSVNPTYWKWWNQVIDITDKIYARKFSGKQITKRQYEKGTFEYVNVKFEIPTTPKTKKFIF